MRHEQSFADLLFGIEERGFVDCGLEPRRRAADRRAPLEVEGQVAAPVIMSVGWLVDARAPRQREFNGSRSAPCLRQAGELRRWADQNGLRECFSPYRSGS
jgi:hypothetical protein